MSNLNTPSRIEMIQPDDWHLHIRDGDVMKDVLADTARQFARAIIMPNLKPPVTTVDLAKAYQSRINANLKTLGITSFTPLMTLYLTDNTSAELIKYASNTFLAMKLSFVNEIAALCENLDANIYEVLLGLGKDDRIGKKFLEPGPGWGGSCFPKDVKALSSIAEDNKVQLTLIKAIYESNLKTIKRIVDRIERELGGNLVGKNISVLGLTFKANTDDLRESPAVEVANRLIDRGAKLKAYDPVIKKNSLGNIQIKVSLEDCLKEADIIVVLTEWKNFSEIDVSLVSKIVRNRIVFDTRNVLNKNNWIKEKFKLIEIGRH